MTSQAKRSPCFRNGHIMWFLLFILIDNNDELIGRVIGGVLGAVGLLSLVVAISVLIIIGIQKGWDNTNCVLSAYMYVLILNYELDKLLHSL